MTKYLRRSSAALLTVLLLFSACSTGPRWQGPINAHFDGERFIPQERFDKSFWDLVRFWWEKPPSQWRRQMDLPPGPAPLARVGPGRARVTFINHATVLVQVDGLNILTDPVFSERVGPLSWFGSRRFRPPGLAFDELPAIDLVLISHNHYDHLDLPSLRRLQQHSQPYFFVPPGDAGWLAEAGLSNLVELDWGQPRGLSNGCRLWSVESRHWSQRGLSDRNRSLWLAFVLDSSVGPIYFAGDTGYGPHFTATTKRHGPMRLALLPIGAYEPRWLTGYQHMDPGQAVQAHLDLNAADSLGIHWGSFELSAEGPEDPPRELQAQLASRRLAMETFVAPEHGQALEFDVLSDGTHRRCQPTTDAQPVSHMGESLSEND